MSNLLRNLSAPILGIVLTGTFALAEDTPAHHQLEVGAFDANAPYGMAILVDRGAAFSIHPEADGKGSKYAANDVAYVPYGTTAADGSYATSTFTHGGSKIKMTWGRLNDHAVGAVLTCDQAVTLPLHLPHAWSGCKSIYWKEGDGLGGEGFAGNIGDSVYFHLHTQPPLAKVDANFKWEASMDCTITPGQPTILVASIGDEPPPAFDTVAATLEAAGKAYAARRVAAEGDWGDFTGAIADVMNGSRLFSSIDRRVAHVVGRGWWIFNQAPINGDADQGPYFCWDSFFNGDLASLEDPASARDTIRAVLSLEDPDGMVANYSHWPANYEYISADRSQPPVGSLCVWKIEQRWPDKDFLAEVYPKLVKWHDWWHKKRAKEGDFLLSWGSGTGSDIQDAHWETGWDDTQAFPGAKFVGTCLDVYAVDLNSLWAMDAENLAKIAGALGKSDDAARFRGEHERMVKEINDRLWNESLGLYCNRMWDNNPDGSPHFLTRISPMNFYPLICGAPDAARAKRMLDYFHQPTKFWGDYLVPTLPYDDPDWKKQEYWRGHTWAPVNYLLWQGLVRYDDAPHLAEYARRSVKLFMKNWETDDRFCGENYRSDTGTADDHPHYTWGALLPLIGVESLVDIGPDLKPVPRQLGFTENLTLHHIPIGGKFYRVANKSGKIVVTPE